jgi:hypothetical protein
MTDNVDALEALLEVLPGAVDRRRLGDRLNQSMEKLRTGDYNAARLASLRELAPAIGFGSSPQQLRVLQEVREEAWAVGEALEEAETAEQLRDAVLEYEKGLSASLGSLDREVRIHWSSFAAATFRPLIPLGEMLVRTGVDPELGKRLSDCGRRALAPSDGGSVAELSARVKGLLAERESLDAERSGLVEEGEIGAFLSALADQKATLAMVTPKVAAWLADKHALERFSVAPL